MENLIQNKKLIAIGEALIDFIPDIPGGAIKDVNAFLPAVGGAPANVCGAFTKLGGRSEMITQLGTDGFGDKILETFKNAGIGSSFVKRTDKANTSLAFVALQEDGNREFSFYRNPGADMLFEAEDVNAEWFEDAYALHFCSVSLGDFPMKEAHCRAIQYAMEKDAIVSFDPNLRPALWKDSAEMIATVKEFIPLADIVKISDEELESITGETSIETALEKLFTDRVKLVIYTEGSKGAKAFTKKASAVAECAKVKAVDTTGAGDGFIGAFLWCLYRDGVTAERIEELRGDKLEEYLKFANAFCGISVQKKGAIPSYPTLADIEYVDRGLCHHSFS
ncbi:MAG: carbohydrate kinase [Lachnospiraceae bacterium]|nr:carbohydrate kinase [Lachnospiraceae bacterium]